MTTDMTTECGYIQTKDVPGEYAIPRQTVLRLMREGALTGHRVTQKVTLFKRSEIEALIASSATVHGDE